jgi:hypothetical protein
MRKLVHWFAAAALLLTAGIAGAAMAVAQPERVAEAQAGKQPKLERVLGSVKSIEGNVIRLSPDSGPDVTVNVKEGARLLRVEPGEKDLSHAVPLQLSELQKDDRIRVRGTLAPDGKTLIGLEVIAIKHLDIQAKQQKERADWQAHGIGGLVKAVDPAAGTITVSVGSLGGAKPVVIRTTQQTILRRYAPDSVKFDDARPAPLNQVKPGDQLRARGTRSADGAEMAAEEVVSGTFRNIAGTISTLDPGAMTLTVNDLLSKQTVTIHISAQSQLRKLPPEMAQGMAIRLKAAASAEASGAPGAGGAAPGSPAQVAAAAGEQRAGGPAGAGTSAAGGARPGGTRDFQQMINRLPQVTLADLQKGQAVILVASGGASASEVTAITLLGGVEPILTATPRGAQGFTLSPWTMGGGAMGEGGEPPGS